MKVIIIDNYDSFTFNIYQYVAEILKEEPVVIRNNQLTYEEFQKLSYDAIILSPGPGRPDRQEDFGICKEIIEKEDVPILGICLGHQGIALAFGGEIGYASEPYHGRKDYITHEHDLFNNIPQSFQVIRYHSILVEDPLPKELVCIARNKAGMIMGISHKTKPIFGIQFHPESICTDYGLKIIENFCILSMNYQTNQKANKIKPLKKISIIPEGKLVKQGNMEKKYKVYSKKVDSYFEANDVFETLYADNEEAAWLDSSKIMEGFSRFSFIADMTGPLFEKLVYYGMSKRLKIEKRHKKEIIFRSIFEYMDDKLTEFSVDNSEFCFDFNCGFVGVFGYEMKRECGHKTKYHSNLPDAVFLFVDRILAFDHLKQELFLVTLSESKQLANEWFGELEQILAKNISHKKRVREENRKNSRVSYELNQERETYLKNIDNCIQQIKEGESYEICLTNKMKFSEKIDAWSYYKSLRVVNAAPYSAFFKFKEFSMACASPERFITINTDRTVEAKPMKGTIKRGETFKEDKRLKKELEQDEKTQAENLMICDLLRNDLGLVCEIGSISVPQLMLVETFASVHQMSSLIRGKLKKNISAIECIKNIFPGGSMTGAPKKRSIEIIEDLEKEARGIYSGSVGFLGLNGSADFNIVIRTAVFMEDHISIGVGGAIIYLSEPEDEFDEIILKGQAMIDTMNAL